MVAPRVGPSVAMAGSRFFTAGFTDIHGGFRVALALGDLQWVDL